VTEQPLLFALLGSGERGLPWSAELPAILPCATTISAQEHTAGVIVAGSLSSTEFDRLLVMVSRGMAVLVMTPAQLEADQIRDLARTARLNRAPLRFAQPVDGRDSEFLQRTMSGQEPLLRPRSIHVLRLASREHDSSLSEHVHEELAAASLLRGEVPTCAQAVANHPETDRASGIFLTLKFADGMTVRCTISLTEGISSRQVMFVAQERTVLLNGEVPRDQAKELAAFCDAVRAGDDSSANAEFWSGIAMLWAAVDGMLESAPQMSPLPVGMLERHPPRLRIIEGGGNSGGRGPRPHLRLVAS
jgi:hypothetical protein